MGRPIALTIAGSDSSGGAGIQADLKTFSALGVYGASVITALTAQNTTGVQGVHPVPASFVVAQLRSVLDDLDVRAVKTGMLANAAIVEAVAAALGDAPDLPVVVDPVMVATSGDLLLEPEAITAIRSRLLPRATLVTPNIPEAAQLAGAPAAETIDAMIEQGCAILAAGARAVLVKGGHGTGDEAVDVLVRSSADPMLFRGPRIETRHTHGTGCTLSSAIAAHLARGLSLEDAIARAKIYVRLALEAGRDLGVGKGHGPVDHLYATDAGAMPST